MADTVYLGTPKPVSEHDENKVASYNALADEFDSAIAGLLSIAITTADVTLTRAQALNKVLVLTGTLTGNRVLFIPATGGSGRDYIIWNTTSGAFTVTVKTTAGGSTGPTVAQSSAALLFHDNTNVSAVVSTGGSGDMILASVQTVTGAKTFDATKLIIGPAVSPSVVARSFYYDSTAGKLFFGKNDGSAWAEIYVQGLTGAISVPNGGTGATTLTGILKGNGTSAFTAATAGTDYVIPTATMNDQTGTTYTLVAADNGKVVTLSNAAAITLTLPSGLGAGFNCLVIQKGAGQVTFTASGTTIRQRQSHTKTAGQYATCSLVCHVANEFILGGDTAA